MTSTSLFDGEPTFLGALTTTFTPPASCSGLTAAVDSDGIPFQMYTGGVADALYINSEALHPECYPSGYPATAGDNFGAYFSPGVCPYGYTTAATMVVGPETRAICCMSGLEANDILGCTTSITDAVLTASQYWTIAPGPVRAIETGVKSAGRIDLLGSAIEVRNRAGGGDSEGSSQGGSASSSSPTRSLDPSQSVITPSSSLTTPASNAPVDVTPTLSFPSGHATLTVGSAISTAGTGAASSVDVHRGVATVALALLVIRLLR